MFYYGLFCRAAKSVAKINKGGVKILTFQQIHSATITISALKGGPNSIANFDGGAMAGFAPPWIRRCEWGTPALQQKPGGGVKKYATRQQEDQNNYMFLN